MDQDGKMTNLQMTSEDEQQILSEKPALRQIYEAQVRTYSLSGFVFPVLQYAGRASLAQWGVAEAVLHPAVLRCVMCLACRRVRRA